MYFLLLDGNNKQVFTPSRSYYHLRTRLPPSPIASYKSALSIYTYYSAVPNTTLIVC